MDDETHLSTVKFLRTDHWAAKLNPVSTSLLRSKQVRLICRPLQVGYRVIGKAVPDSYRRVYSAQILCPLRPEHEHERPHLLWL